MLLSQLYYKLLIYSLKTVQYLKATSLTVPKLAMVVKTGIRPLWRERFRVHKYLDQGDPKSIKKFGIQKKIMMQKLVDRALK